MAENVINQFLEVQNASNWTETKQNEVDANGQIVFVPGDVNAIYAKGKNYGDGAKSDKVKITEDIMVDGGPLADQVKSKFPNGITAGMDLQEVLMALFCKVLYPTGISRDVDDKASFSIAAPAITMKLQNTETKLTSGNIYEVGKALSFVAESKTYSKSLPVRYVRNMTYGYTVDYGNNGKYTAPNIDTEFGTDGTISTNDKYEVNWRETTTGNVDYTVEVTSASGFVGLPALSELKSTGANKTLTITTYPTISAGTNTISVKNTGTGSFTATVTHMPAIKVNANNGKQPAKDENNKPAISYGRVDFDSVSTSKVESSSSFTVYGINPIKFNANSCQYNNKGSDIVSHDGNTINNYVPSGAYKSAGQSVTLYLGFGNSTAANTTGTTAYKLWIPANLVVSNFAAKLFDQTLANCWDGTANVANTVTTETLSGVSYKLYTLNVSGVGSAGIKVTFTWKF